MITKIIAVIVILIVVYFIRVWMSKSYSSLCPNCGHKFKPPALEYIATFHMGGKRYLKCPSCGKRALMESVYDNSESDS